MLLFILGEIYNIKTRLSPQSQTTLNPNKMHYSTPTYMYYVTGGLLSLNEGSREIQELHNGEVSASTQYVHLPVRQWPNRVLLEFHPDHRLIQRRKVSVHGIILFHNPR